MHLSCITRARPEEQIQKPRAINIWSYAARIALPSWPDPFLHGDVVFLTFLTLFVPAVPPWHWGVGVPNLAYNGKYSNNWPKRPTLMILYLHGYGEHQSNQTCLRHIAFRSPYMPHVNLRGCLWPFSP